MNELKWRGLTLVRAVVVTQDMEHSEPMYINGKAVWAIPGGLFLIQ